MDQTNKGVCAVHKNIQHDIDKLENKIDSKATTKTLMAIAIIVTGILGGAFTVLYSQGSGISNKVNHLLIEQKVLKTRFDSFVENHNTGR